jgi:hypothetical protein
MLFQVQRRGHAEVVEVPVRVGEEHEFHVDPAQFFRLHAMRALSEAGVKAISRRAFHVQQE